MVSRSIKLLTKSYLLHDIKILQRGRVGKETSDFLNKRKIYSCQGGRWEDFQPSPDAPSPDPPFLGHLSLLFPPSHGHRSSPRMPCSRHISSFLTPLQHSWAKLEMFGLRERFGRHTDRSKLVTRYPIIWPTRFYLPAPRAPPLWLPARSQHQELRIDITLLQGQSEVLDDLPRSPSGLGFPHQDTFKINVTFRSQLVGPIRTKPQIFT